MFRDNAAHIVKARLADIQTIEFEAASRAVESRAHQALPFRTAPQPRARKLSGTRIAGFFLFGRGKDNLISLPAFSL